MRVSEAIKAFFENRNRAIAWRYLEKKSKEHVKVFPQMCCYSFEHIAQHINFDGRYEREELEFICKTFSEFIVGRTVLDIGANIGNHALTFAERAQKVFAFEPHPVTYKLLELNCTAIRNIETFNVGASERRVTVKAVSPVLNSGCASIESANGPDHVEAVREVQFDVVPLDDVEELKDADIGFVKIDVEGHELAALKGMSNLLATRQAVVAFEQHPQGIKNGTSEVVELLKQFGYLHFYETVYPRLWRTPDRLVGLIRLPLKLAELIVFGKRNDAIRLSKVSRLGQKSYFLLFASKQELSVEQLGIHSHEGGG